MLLIGMVCITLAAPIALDNGAIRIEIEPELFTIRFIGAPGGENFVEPIYVDPSLVEGREWVDPGGLYTDLVGADVGQDGALRRGPAEIIEHKENYIALLGPPSPKLKVRIKKEIRLDPKEARAYFYASAIGLSKTPVEGVLRNTARVPQGTTLRVLRADDTIRTLAGRITPSPAVTPSMKYWLIPVPPTTRMDKMVLGAFVSTVEHRAPSGLQWTRHLVTMPDTRDEVPHEATFLCLLDSTTRTYGASLQSQKTVVTQAQPAFIAEEWTLER